MRYRVICDTGEGTFVLYDTADRNRFLLTQGVVTFGDEGAGKFVFSYLPDHPNADHVRLMESNITVMNGEKRLFCGRPITREPSFYNEKKVTCEGNLNWLHDVPDTFSAPESEIYEYVVGEFVKRENTPLPAYGDKEGYEKPKLLEFFAQKETDDEGVESMTGIYKHDWTTGDYNVTIVPSDEGTDFEIFVGIPVWKTDSSGEAERDGGELVFETEAEEVTNLDDRTDVTKYYIFNGQVSCYVNGSWANVDKREAYKYTGKRETETLIKDYIMTGDSKKSFYFMGNSKLWNEDFEPHADTVGSGSVFTDTPSSIAGAKMLVQSRDLSELGVESIFLPVTIRRRKKIQADVIFGWIFPEGDRHGYNGLCDPRRKLYPGSCNVTGEITYDPKENTSCLDTLNALKKELGGYIYTQYDEETEHWHINYRYLDEAGDVNNNVKFRFGETILDISGKSDASKIVSAIYGIGKDRLTGDEFTLEEWGDYTLSDIDDSTFYNKHKDQYRREKKDDDSYTGYIFNVFLVYIVNSEGELQYDTYGDPIYKCGYIRQRKSYTITHNNDTNYMKFLLWKEIVMDLEASCEDAENLSVTAIDPAISNPGEEIVLPHTWYQVYSSPHGLNKKMLLTKADIDLLSPGNSKFTFGEKKALLTDAAIQGGNIT